MTLITDIKNNIEDQLEHYNRLVTIVVPAYNAETYLKENIASILGQTYKNLEVIYICDGCTDNTADILMQFTTDNRLKVCVEAENRGAAFCRNKGMEMASGEWIIFLDADDLFEANMIEEMVTCAVSTKSDICCCYWESFTEKPDWKHHVANEMRKIHCKSYPVIETQRQLRQIMQLVDKGPSTKLVHESIYRKEKVYFQNLPNSNDVYYSMICAINARKIVYVDKVFLHYRSDNGRSTLSTERNRKKPYILEAYDKVYEYIASNENKKDLLISFYNEICACILFYLDKPVIDIIIDELVQKYLTKWEMINKEELHNVLSYVNREIYKCILQKDMRESKDKLVLSARVEFVRQCSQAGCSVWGIGQVGEELLAAISQTDITVNHVYDSSKEKQGKIVSGYLVEGFGECEVQEDNVIITSAKYYEEIRERIGTRAKKIWNLEEQIWKIT